MPPPDAVAAFLHDGERAGSVSAPAAHGNPGADVARSPRPETSSEAEDVEAVTPGQPLTLEAAVALGLRLNPTLEVMRERVAQAEAGRLVAFADFLPQASASYRKFAGDPGDAPFALPTLPNALGNIAPAVAADRFDRAELNVQWVVWDFGRAGGRFGQAVDAVEIARLQYSRARQTVGYEVATAYFAVGAARASRRVAEEAVRRAASVLNDARNFLKRGTAVRNDVLRAEVLLAESRLALVKARTAEAAAVAALNRAMGVNINAPTEVVSGPCEPPFHLSLAECLERAAQSRDEFGVVLRAIRSARLGTGVAQAEFLPKIVVGGVGLHEHVPGRRDLNLAAGGLSLEVALFEGGRRIGRVRAAEADARAALARAKDVCDLIAYEVTLAYLAVDDARQRIALARTAAEQSAENLRVVRGQFDRGDATPTEVVDAELALTRAEQNLIAAVYDYQAALARLRYAAGAPPEPDSR